MTTTIQSKNSTQSAILVNGVEAAVFDAGGISGIAGINGGQLAGMRNRIINGNMRIDQRNNGGPFSGGGQYTIDRWALIASQSSKVSAQRNWGGWPAPTSFTNYLGASSTSAYSILTDDYFGLDQRVEGFNSADFAWGTSEAKSITLSFWVRSSLTGLFGGSFRNNIGDRNYPFSYAISVANTWEYKTVIVAGDTSGTWATDSSIGIRLSFSIGTGTTRQGPAGAWSGTTYFAPTGQTSLVGTNGATWYVTGVQLELGPVATPFEQRPYGLELALCQRYCQIPVTQFINAQYGTYNSIGQVLPLPVNMRATPTISGVTSYTIQGVTSAATGVTMVASHNSITAQWTGTNGLFDRQAALLSPNQQAVLSAEL